MYFSFCAGCSGRSMPTYIYSGLHPRQGTIPVHTFFSSDGGKPVVAMKSSIVIDGQSLQKMQLKEATFMLNAFQHFHITDIYRTNQEYDYALVVENLENDLIPDKLVDCVSKADATYIGIIIDHNPRDGTYTVGCGPRVFTNVFSDFSCTDPSKEFPSVHIQTRYSFISCGNIYDYEADITCMKDCIYQDLPPSNSPLHDVEQGTSAAAAMPHEPDEASSIEVPECRHKRSAAEYLSNCQPTASSACSVRAEPLTKDAEYGFPLEHASKPDSSTAGNEMPISAENSSCTPTSPDDFEAYKPTIPTDEKTYKTLYDEEYTVTI